MRTLTLLFHITSQMGMGGMNPRLYSVTLEDFHTRPLIIKKSALRVNSYNSTLNTVSLFIIKTLGHSYHPDYATITSTRIEKLQNRLHQATTSISTFHVKEQKEY